MDTEIVLMTVITDRKKAGKLLDSLAALGGKLFSMTYGKGYANSGNILEAFGFVPEQEKAVINFLIKRVKADEVFEMLRSEYNFNKPNTGIAFSVPVDRINH